MIKIRYSDLPGGLHLTAAVRGKHTILFLLPGLTAAQRKAAIRRARSAARVGHGPGLPAAGLARAVAADRIATTVRNGLAAMRMHPAVFLPPLIMVMSAAVAYVLLVSVSLRLYPPQASGKGPVLGGASSGAVHRAGGTRHQGTSPAGGLVPGAPGSPSPALPSPGQSSHRPPGSPSPGASASPAPDPSSSRPPGSPAPSPSPSSLPSPSPSATPGSSSGGGGVCVKIGPLGVCLNV